MKGSNGRIGAIPGAARRRIGQPAGVAGPKPIASAVALALLALNGMHPGSALAAPAGEQLVGGAATVLRPNAHTTVIDQTSQRAALNWTSFGIAAGESVIFKQPSASAVALNRVMGSEASHIYGSLLANGQVFLVNPNGVTFARGASVDVGGIVASTLGITNNDFMAGRYVFSGGGTAGAIENHANIRAANGGYVAFLGNQVTNTGTITANRGSVAFGAGDAMQLDFHGDGLLTLKVDAAAANAKLENSGVITADGGQVFLTARAKNALVSTAINMDGVITARGLSERNGRIVLDGGTSGVTQVSGTLDANSAQGKGGDIRVLGEYVGLFGNAKLDASGAAGGGTVLVGGDFQGQNPNVSNALRTYVGPNATIRADAITSGDGGKVIVWADDTTRFYGSINARGGAESGNGGFVEVSGKEHLTFRGKVDTSAPNGVTGTLLLDPANIVIQSGTGDGDDADASNASFTGDPSGAAGTVVSGDTGPSTLFESELEGISATTNISIAASATITINDLADNALSLQQTAGNSVTFTAPTVTMAGANDTIVTQGGALTFNASTGASLAGGLNSNGGLITVNVGGASSVGGTIAGAGTALTKAGAGTLTLSGANTYTGATNINGGVISISSDANLGAAPGAATPGQLTFDGGTLEATSTFVLGATRGIILNGAGGTLQVNPTFTLTYNGDAAGAGGLTKTGTGTLSLAGNNTYAGSTTISAGTLSVSGGNAIPDASAVAIADVAGATLSLINSETIGSLGGGGTTGGTVDLNANTLTTGDATSTAFGGQITGGGGVLTKQGTGSFTVTGNNTHSGGTTLNSGTLRAQTSATALGSGTLTLNGGTLQLASDTATGFNNNTTVTANTIVQSDRVTAGAGVTHTLGALSIGAQTLTVQAGSNVTSGTAGVTVGATTLTGSATFAPASGALLTVGTIDGAGQTLTVNGAGGITFAGAVGAGAGLGALSATAGSIGLANGNVTTTGAQTYNGPITLGAATTLTSSGNANINLAGTVNGAQTLLINTTGITTLGGVVGGTAPLTSVTTNAGGTTLINSPVTTTGAQTYNDAVTLAANLTTDGGAIQFAQLLTLDAASVTIDTDQTQNAAAAGAVTFDNTVNGATAGTTTLIVDARGTGTDAGGTVTFSNTVGAGTRLGGLAVGGAGVTFSGTNNVDNLAAALSGATNGVTYVDADALTVSTVGGIAGVTTNSGPVSLTAAGVLTASNVVNTTGSGTTTLTTTGAATNNIVVDASVGNTGAATILTAVGNIGGTGVVSGGSVTLDSATGVGGAGALINTTATTLAARSTTSGGVFVNETDAVTLNTIGLVGNGAAAGGAYDVLAGGALSVAGPITTSGGSVTLSAPSVTSTVAGTITTTAAANTVAASGNVFISATGNPGAMTLAGNIVTTGADHNAAAGNAGGDVTLSTVNGAMSVAGIATTGGNALAGNDVGGNAGTITLTIGGANSLTLNGNLSSNGGNAAGTGTGGVGRGIAFADDRTVVLGADVIINARGGTGTTAGASGDVTFNASVNSAAAGSERALTVNSAGVTTFGNNNGDDRVGFAVALSSLTTDAGGSTVFNVAPANLPTVTTTNAQTFNDNVVLAQDAILTSTTGGNVTFNGSVNSQAANSERGLTVNTTGATTFGNNAGDDRVGAGIALSSLTTNAGGTTVFNVAPAFTPTVTTTTTQTYNDNVVLAQNTVLTSTGGGDVSFNGRVNSQAVLSERSLQVNTQGATRFGSGAGDQRVGFLVSLLSLATDAGGTTIFNVDPAIGPPITADTKTTQTYNDNVVLAQNTTLVSASGGIVLAGTVNGTAGGAGESLTVAAGAGNVTFTGAVGGIERLSSVTASGSLLNIGSVSTTGAQSYTGTTSTTLSGNLDSSVGGAITITGPALLGPGPLTVQTAGAAATDDITFTGTINGAQSLTLNAGAGDVLVQGIIGGTAPLTALTATGNTLTFQQAANFAGPVVLNADDMTLAAINAAGQTVTLRNRTLNRSITLGGEPGGTLGLGAAELAGVTANRLRIGRNDAAATDAITIASTVSPNVNELHLIGATISGTSGGVVVPALVLEAGTTNLANSSSNVITLAAVITPAGAPFAYTGDATGVIIGSVDGISGITTNNGNVTIATGGTLTLNEAISAGVATVALQGSSIVSNGTTGFVTASTLSTVSTAGSTLLNALGNDVTTYSGQANTAGSIITLVDTNGFSLSGIAAAGSEARLLASAGAITQTAGTITVGQLSVVARDSSSFALAGNDIGTLSASLTGAGQSLVYRDSNAFTAGLTALAPAGANSVQTNAGNVTLTADAGTLTLANSIAAAGATVSLNATTGAIAQNAGAGITATTLTGTAGTSATLDKNNALTSLGAFTTGGAFTLNDAGGLNVTGAVTTQNAGVASLTTSGPLAVTNGSVSGAGVALTTTFATGQLAGGGSISLNGAVNGNAGDVALNSINAISQTATGLINTTGALTGSARSSVTLAEANTIANLGPFTSMAGEPLSTGSFTLNDAGGGLVLTGPVNAGVGVLVPGGGTLSITTAGGPLALQSNDVSGTGGVTLQGVGVTSTGGTISSAAGVGGAPSGAVQVTATGAGAISLGGTIATAGSNNSAGGNGGTGGNVSLTTNNGAISVANVNAAGGSATAGNGSGGDAGTITYTVGGANTLTLNGDQISRGGDAAGTGNAGSGRSLTFAVPTFIGGDATVVTRRGTGLGAATAGDVTFAGILQSTNASNLSVITGGATTFAGAVGGSGNPLGSLSTDAPGSTAINGGLVATVGAQSYLGTVTLGSANTLLGSTGGVAFGGTLDGASNLTVTAGGATTFTGAVGSGTALTSLTTNGGGTTAVNGAGVRTTAAQTYTDAVTLGAADTLLISTGNQPISFASSVNGASNLTVTSAGLTTFGGAVGDTAPLTSLTTNGGGATALNGGMVATSSNQSYGEVVTLGANPALSSSGGSIAFASTIDADAAAMNRTLTASAPTGTVAFSGNIGASQALADLDVTASSIVFNAGGAQSLNVSAQGGNTATFAGPVTLAQNLAFNTTGAGNNSVTFANAVNADAVAGNRTLSLTTGTGSATFGDGVGAGQELGAFTVAGNQLVMSGDVRVNGGGAVDFTNLANMSFTPGASIDTDRAGGATAAGNILFGATTRANPTAASATWTLDANADGGGAAGNVRLGTIGNVTGLNVLNVIGDRVTFAGPVNAVQVFVTANKVETAGDGRIFATRRFDGTAETQAALSLRALTGEGTFGERNAPIQIAAPGLFFVFPNGSNTLTPVFLAGDPNLRPVYQFAEDPSARIVFYNGAAPDSPANRSAQSAITQQLRQLLDEINQAGFSKENIRRQLLQGVILETGLSRPGIDDFVGEGVSAPPSCNGVVTAGGKVDCP